MLLHGLADGNLFKPHAKDFRQFLCVGLGAVCGAEAGHGHRQNVRPGTGKFVHGQNRHQQGKGGVQAAGQADDQRLDLCVGQPLFQAVGLGFQRGILVEQVLGDQREPVIYPGQRYFLLFAGQGQGHVAACVREKGFVSASAGGKKAAVHLRKCLAALAVQHIAAFGDGIVVGDYEIGGGFRLAGTAVSVGQLQTVGIGHQSRKQFAVLPDTGLVGGKMADEIGSRQCVMGGGRYGGSEVRTDFAGDDGLSQVQQNVRAEGDGLTQHRHVGDVRRGRGKGRDRTGLGNDGQNPSAPDGESTVIDLAADGKGQTHIGQHVGVRRCGQNGIEAFQSRVQKPALAVEFAAGGTGEAQFLQAKDHDTLVLGVEDGRGDVSGVFPAVRRHHGKGAAQYANKSVFHVRHLIYDRGFPPEYILPGKAALKP